MTHASGITPSAELSRALAESREERKARGFKIQIDGESLVIRETIEISSDDKTGEP
jgi:hypothetical protein